MSNQSNQVTNNNASSQSEGNSSELRRLNAVTLVTFVREYLKNESDVLSPEDKLP